jgi:hypothetical protein
MRLRERVGRDASTAISMWALRGSQQRRLVDNLRAEILARPVLDHSSLVDGSSKWDLRRRRLADHILDDDPRRFIQWRVIRETMFVSDCDYISAELRALMNHQEWQERWKPALAEDPCGCPIPSRLYQGASANLIHHAYHVLTAEEQLGSIQDFAQIVELGGGYGSFARLLRRLGVTCHYHIHDLPEFAALQRYYLASVASHRGEPAIQENFTFGSSIDELPPRTVSRLLVALWSLSEVPLEDRAAWCDIIAECDGVVIAFQSEFEGIDNRAWFDELQRRVALVWRCWEIPHLPGDFYLVGKREGDRRLPS